MSLIKSEAKKRKEILDIVSSGWSDVYINSKTEKQFLYRNNEYQYFVESDIPRYMLLKGGEGGGKTAAGVVKTLEKLRRGLDGIMVNTDLPQFQKSTWPEFVAWCPWEQVIESQRHRRQPQWTPKTSFDLLFYNELGGVSKLICGGMSENEIEGWEGPNVNFAWFDEARRHRAEVGLKVLSGRTRIVGPNGEPPQLFITSTPKKHWLYNYFGPVEDEDEDEWLYFKSKSFVGTVLTEENLDNLDPNYVEDRGATLTIEERKVYLGAEWGSLDEDAEKFIEIELWNSCRENLPELQTNEPCVVALDGSTGGFSKRIADTFALIVVTRHPVRQDNVAVRLAKFWQPRPGQLLDFEPIKEYLRQLLDRYAIIEYAYDPYQLHDMAVTLRKEQMFFRPFGQNNERLLSDKQLRDLIYRRGISHLGDPTLTKHLDNADAKIFDNGRKLKIIKRTDSRKIDGAVALAMGSSRILYYNLI